MLDGCALSFLSVQSRQKTLSILPGKCAPAVQGVPVFQKTLGMPSLRSFVDSGFAKWISQWSAQLTSIFHRSWAGCGQERWCHVKQEVARVATIECEEDRSRKLSSEMKTYKSDKFKETTVVLWATLITVGSSPHLHGQKVKMAN